LQPEGERGLIASAPGADGGAEIVRELPAQAELVINAAADRRRLTI